MEAKTQSNKSTYVIGAVIAALVLSILVTIIFLVGGSGGGATTLPDNWASLSAAEKRELNPNDCADSVTMRLEDGQCITPSEPQSSTVNVVGCNEGEFEEMGECFSLPEEPLGFVEDDTGSCPEWQEELARERGGCIDDYSSLENVKAVLASSTAPIGGKLHALEEYVRLDNNLEPVACSAEIRISDMITAERLQEAVDFTPPPGELAAFFDSFIVILAKPEYFSLADKMENNIDKLESGTIEWTDEDEKLINMFAAEYDRLLVEQLVLEIEKGVGSSRVSTFCKYDIPDLD